MTSPGVTFCNKTWIDYSAYRIDLPCLGQGSAGGGGGRQKMGSNGKSIGKRSEPSDSLGMGKAPQATSRLALLANFFFFGQRRFFSFFPNAELGSRLRSALIISRCTRSSEAMEQLHWPTLSSGRSYHKAKLVFLCRHSFVPSYFSLYFTRFSNIYNYSTWQSMRLSLPKVTQNLGERTFLFTGAKFFYKLVLDIVKSDKIQTLCRRARNFFYHDLKFLLYFRL